MSEASETSDNLDDPLNNSAENSLADIERNYDSSVSIEGSVVASPSIESFSTLPEAEASVSLGGSDSTYGISDLAVRIDAPQKQTELLETYVTFRVSTKTSREGYASTTYSVRRRYNDFVWLRQHLVEAYPTHFVPPLPLKHSLIGQFDRYGREFVTARMAALQIFILRIVNHPVLSFAPCIKCFLTATVEEFNEVRKLTNPSLLAKMSHSLKGLSTLHIETHRPQEFNKFLAYLDELSDKLNHINRISQRIKRERIEQEKALLELKLPLQSWAGADVDLSQELCEIASAVDKSRLALHQILLDSENLIFTQPLKEYILYVDAIKEALERRDELEIEYLFLKEQLEKKQADLEATENEGAASYSASIRSWMKPFENKEERVEKLTQAVVSARRAMEMAKDNMECANENIRSDMERWQSDKKLDFKNILSAFADQHISYYDQCAKAWTDLLTELNYAAR